MEDERELWVAYKRAIDSILRRATAESLKQQIPELFRKVNLLWCLGLFVRQTMRRQLEDYDSTAVYAALVAVVNVHFDVAELIISRVILQFRKFYLRNDERVWYPLVFVGHLVNQRVCLEVVALQILQLLLLDQWTASSVEMAVELTTTIGEALESKPDAAATVYARFRELLKESRLNRDNQRRVKRLFDHRRGQFRQFPRVVRNLNLVDPADRPTPVFVDMNGALQAHDDQSRFYPAQNLEEEYKEMLQEILPEEETQDAVKNTSHQPLEHVVDLTDSERLGLQKRVYQSIMSSLSANEAVHKLVKLQITPVVVADMVIKCCAQEKTYTKFFGEICDRLAQRPEYHEQFVGLFARYYDAVSEYDANAVRNLGRLFGHMFALDYLALDQLWEPLKLTAETTSAATRIFLKFVFQQFVEELGVTEVHRRVSDPAIAPLITGLFPEAGEDHLRYLINFFTAIGLGALTEDMRRRLEEEEARGRDFSRSRSGSYSRSRSGSYSRSNSRSYSRSRLYSRSP